MYTLAVRREFIARHFLIGGDWGPENKPNSHKYVLELQLDGPTLDTHGYLCDIVDVERHLEDVIAGYAERMLNDLPEFAGLNPSLEHFARILTLALNGRLSNPAITGLRLVLWENDSAWASFAAPR
jgi:6-pyruvoyltetrahydropterin/6-carboxytetrahydropterin synthase